MTRFIAPSRVKQFALEVAAERRPAAGFRRVGKEFIDAACLAGDEYVKNWIIDRVTRHPSKGVTLK